MFCILLIIQFMPSLAWATAQLDPEALTILETLKKTTQTIQSYRVTQTLYERFGEKMGELTTIDLKYDNSTIYFHVLDSAEKGAEAIYSPLSNWVWAHQGHFPDITIPLNIYSRFLVSSKHHPINEAGFSYLVNTTLRNIDVMKQFDEGELSLQHHTTADGRIEHIIEMKMPVRTFNYQLEPSDTSFSIAKKFNSSAYWILHVNHLHSHHALKTSALIRIPSYYAQRVIFTIDAQTHQLSQADYFDQSDQLYERYTWRDFKEQVFTHDDFDRKNKKYHF